MAKKAAAKQKLVITQPKDGSICARIWAICDKYKGDRQKVLKECAAKKISAGTSTTQYGRWRVFNGYVRPKAVKVAKPAKKGPPAKKAAKKAPPRKVKPAAAAPAETPAAAPENAAE